MRKTRVQIRKQSTQKQKTKSKVLRYRWDGLKKMAVKKERYIYRASILGHYGLKYYLLLISQINTAVLFWKAMKGMHLY